MLLHLLVMISITCIHSFERYTWPESVVSIWMVGIDPMIWTSKEGDEVMDNEDTAESRTRDVFLHPTAFLSVEYVLIYVPMVTALILPEIWTTELTQLKMWTVWCSSVFSILIDLLSSWFSCDMSVVICQSFDETSKSEKRETYNDPFISIFELNLCRLLHRLCARLGLERRGLLCIVRDSVGRTKCGILVGHLGAIDLSQSRGDSAATVQIGQKGGGS